MGLDGVEIIMATEETFGVTIEDADAQKMTTPREVINLVCEKLGIVNGH